MPAGDGRGPNFTGPMTGRGARFCAGDSVQGYTAGSRGRGFNGTGSWNCRGGRGWRNRFYSTGRSFYGREFQSPPGIHSFSRKNIQKKQTTTGTWLNSLSPGKGSSRVSSMEKVFILESLNK